MEHGTWSEKQKIYAGSTVLGAKLSLKLINGFSL
jgi:hypothetical protein